VTIGRRGVDIARRGVLALPTMMAAGMAHAAQPATLLVGAPAGSGPDLWARSVAPFLERHWARAQITVVNRPGHGGISAVRSLASAAPDGLTIAAVGTPVLLARAVEQGQTALLERLQFVASVVEEPLLLVVPAGGPSQSIDALRALPPSAMLGTPPAGNAAQLAGATLAARLGLTPFAFANAVAVRQAVQAGHVQAAMLAAPEAMGLLREGRITALAVASFQRNPLLPEIPTLREQGLAFSAVSCRGFALPGGTPRSKVNQLATALAGMVADPEFISQANDFGYRPYFQGPDPWMGQVRATTAELAARWTTDPWVQRPG